MIMLKLNLIQTQNSSMIEKIDWRSCENNSDSTKSYTPSCFLLNEKKKHIDLIEMLCCFSHSEAQWTWTEATNHIVQFLLKKRNIWLNSWWKNDIRSTLAKAKNSQNWDEWTHWEKSLIWDTSFDCVQNTKWFDVILVFITQAFDSEWDRQFFELEQILQDSDTMKKKTITENLKWKHIRRWDCRWTTLISTIQMNEQMISHLNSLIKS